MACWISRFPGRLFREQEDDLIQRCCSTHTMGLVYLAYMNCWFLWYMYVNIPYIWYGEWFSSCLFQFFVDLNFDYQNLEQHPCLWWKPLEGTWVDWVDSLNSCFPPPRKTVEILLLEFGAIPTNPRFESLSTRRWAQKPVISRVTTPICRFITPIYFQPFVGVSSSHL